MHVLKGQEFYIVYMPKVGMTTLDAWGRSHSEISKLYYRPGHWKTTEFLGPIGFMEPPKPIYSPWRPPLERIIAGIHTGLLVRTQKTLGGSMKPAEADTLKENVAKWLQNPTLEYREIVNHIQLISKVYKNYNYQSWNWFPLEQLGSLHTYLNSKYGTNLSEPQHHNSFAATRDSDFGVDWQNNNPEVMKMLREYVADDYIPENLLQLTDLHSDLTEK